MPVLVNQQGDGPERGVYSAKYAYMGEELKDFEWSPLDRAIIQFELEGQEGTAPFSVPAGDELIFLAWQMTGKSISPGSEDSVFAQAKEALAGCTWNGLVNVGNKRFIQRLQIPMGAYNLRFVRFAIRDDAGRPFWIEKVWKEGNKPSKTTVIEMQVAGGPYDGWLQSSVFTVTFQADPQTQNLQITGKALARVLAAGGVSSEMLIAEVEAVESGGHRFFENIMNPLPEFERMLLREAEKGSRISSTVDEKGNARWDSMVPAGGELPGIPVSQTAPMPLAAPPVTQQPVASSEQEDVHSLRVLMQAVSERIWGNEEPVFTPDGSLTAEEGTAKRGMWLAANVIKTVVAALPDHGIECKWPPMETGWTAQGLALMVDVFKELLAKDEGGLIVLVGSSEASHKALYDFVTATWGSGAPSVQQAF